MLLFSFVSQGFFRVIAKKKPRLSGALVEMAGAEEMPYFIKVLSELYRF